MLNAVLKELELVLPEDQPWVLGVRLKPTWIDELNAGFCGHDRRSLTGRESSANPAPWLTAADCYGPPERGRSSSAPLLGAGTPGTPSARGGPPLPRVARG